MQQSPELRELLRAIRRIAQALDIHSRRIDREVGLTLPQLVVLTTVRELGEVTSRAISREAQLSPPTVVGILDKLEAKELVERYRSTLDRRVVHTRLTRRGAAVLDSAPAPLGPSLEAAFATLPPRERRDILASFDRVAELATADLSPRSHDDAAAD